MIFHRVAGLIKSKRLVVAVLALYAMLFAIWAVANAADVVAGTRSDLAARVSHDRSFAETLKANLEEQRSALEEIKKKLRAAIESSTQRPATYNLDNIITDAELYAMEKDVQQLTRINEESTASVNNWIEATAGLTGRRLALDFSIIGPAYGKVWKSPASAPPAATKPPAAGETPAEASKRDDKFEKLKPFLWAFTVIPGVCLFGFIGCLFSPAAAVQNFAMSMIIGLIGYFMGLGSRAFAMAFA
jgi:hypothetical protein